MNDPTPQPFWEDPDETNGTCRQPGIYRFTIDGEGVYIGRFTNARRPIREYRNNVRKLQERKPYRRRDPDGFRYIHIALFKAVQEGRRIKIEIVENVEAHLLNERERLWISKVPIELRLNDRKRIRC